MFTQVIVGRVPLLVSKGLPTQIRYKKVHAASRPVRRQWRTNITEIESLCW